MKIWIAAVLTELLELDQEDDTDEAAEDATEEAMEDEVDDATEDFELELDVATELLELLAEAVTGLYEHHADGFGAPGKLASVQAKLPVRTTFGANTPLLPMVVW
jgi:hypothetical protein